MGYTSLILSKWAMQVKQTESFFYVYFNQKKFFN